MTAWVGVVLRVMAVWCVASVVAGLLWAWWYSKVKAANGER